jgi:hypothetical protein
MFMGIIKNAARVYQENIKPYIKSLIADGFYRIRNVTCLVQKKHKNPENIKKICCQDITKMIQLHYVGLYARLNFLDVLM